MGRQRRLALLGLAAASLVLATGSGAFTATSADRPISVSVVEDDEAYVGAGDTLQCGAGNSGNSSGNGNGTNQNFVRNQFGDATVDISITASVPTGESGEIRIGTRGNTTQIESGGSTTFHVTDVGPGDGVTIQVKPLKKNADSLNEVHLRVEATGDGIDATVERAVVVKCSS